MDRFFDGDEYLNNSYDEYDEEMMDEEQYAIEYLGKEGMMHVINMDFAHKELRTHVLTKAIEIAQKSFFWRFRSDKYKVEKVATLFIQLKSLLEIE